MENKKQKNYKGFTLLELLVVVLIIGILAAIALPQYQIAVKVAKIKGLYPAMRALVEARTNYYLIHNTFPTNINLLDVEIPYNRKEGNVYYTDWGYFYLINDPNGGYKGCVEYSVNGTGTLLRFHYGHMEYSWGIANNGYCSASKTNVKANKICAKLGKYRTDSSTSNIYIF